jgi:ABC-2 type transport system permease protein
MSTQLKASFNKELLAFLRTYKLFIMTAVIIGWSVFSPLMLVGLGFLVNSMGDIYDELGVDMSSMTEQLTSTASTGVSSQVSDISSIGIIVFILVISSFAGGEQKKRSIIIPHSSGLNSFSYLFPKFIIYPITIFILSLLGTIAAGVLSGLIFDYNDLVFSDVLSAGVLLGFYGMFYICLHLTLGTGTGKPWISSAICIAALMLLPSIFAIANASPAFNPFTVSQAAVSAVYGAIPSSEIAIGICVALVLIVILFFVALFTQNARKIDNSGNETLI